MWFWLTRILASCFFVTGFSRVFILDLVYAWKGIRHGDVPNVFDFSPFKFLIFGAICTQLNPHHPLNQFIVATAYVFYASWLLVFYKRCRLRSYSLSKSFWLLLRNTGGPYMAWTD